MEYVQGVALEDYINRCGRVAPHRAGLWLGQLCQVLHAAHNTGILHRDLSLANLMLVGADTAKETIKVLDFGLARLTNSLYVPLENLTGQKPAMGGGTPDYVCPEQLKGDSVDARGDLYSVGVILFKLLTGHLPFEFATEAEDILQAQIEMPPPTFAKVGVRDVPPGIEAVVQHCLAKFPAERPASAKELALLYGRALGAPIASADAFPDVRPNEADVPAGPTRHVLDRFEAFMPEQIAAVKLRGFIGEVGGEVLDSQPGYIRMRLVDPREPEIKPGFDWFGLARRRLPPPRYLFLDLHMTKKQNGLRSLVEIAVVLAPQPNESRDDAKMREGFGQRICRELRAFLMIGR